MNQFTLESLYSNGIIDYIPDVYGNSSYPNNCKNPYLTDAMSGDLYKQAGMPDSYSSISNNSDAKKGKGNTFSYLKGFLAAGIMIGATVMCFKKGKKPPVENASKPSFFNRLFGKKHKINKN